MTSNSSVELRLLGRFEYNDHPLKIPRKARALLAYVAEHDLPLGREQLATQFCSESVDPRRTLRTLLSPIRRGAPRTLDDQGNRVSLRAKVWLDCQTFAQLVDGQQVSAQTLALYRGDFMGGSSPPDLPEYEIWLLGRRSYYRPRYERALLAVARAHVENGSPEQALTEATQLVQSNPYLEEGHALVLQILVAAGRRGKARAPYDHFRAVLRRDLGIEPTVAFHEMLSDLSVLAGSDGETPAARSPSRPAFLLLGADSPAFFQEMTEPIHAALPVSRIAVMPGQKHIAMYAAPELFAEEVASFLLG